MKISDYILGINRSDIAAYYELRAKNEERKAHVTITLIMFAIFYVVPFMLTRTTFELLGATDESTCLLDIIIIQSLMIVMLAIGLTTNAYRCGKLFRTLRKNDNLGDMLKYISELEEDSPQIRVAYILHFQQYLYSYITDDKTLVIVYSNDGNRAYYKTHDYEMLCNSDCQNITLLLDINGIHLIDQSMEEKI